MNGITLEEPVQGAKLFESSRENDEMQVMAYKPPTFGNMAATSIQFDFSVYNQIAPSFPPNESFAYENAENEATFRRKDRLMDCRKRRFTGMMLPGGTPAKRNRNESLQSAPSVTKSVASCVSPQCSVSCTPTLTIGSVSSGKNQYVSSINMALPSPIQASSMKKEVVCPVQTESQAWAPPRSPNTLLLDWQPFNTDSESCDVEMCNAEMQDLNIWTKSGEQVQLDINIQNYLPENITIMTADNELVVSGKRQEIVDSNLVQRKFSHTYSLPSHFDAESITPDFAEGGKMTLLCPKLENYVGQTDGEIQLQTIDNDRTVIKKNWEPSAIPNNGKFKI